MTGLLREARYEMRMFDMDIIGLILDFPFHRFMLHYQCTVQSF